MKKITMLMLLAILVLPMSAKISTTIAPYQANKSKVANYLASRNGLSPKIIVATDNVATLKAIAPKEDGSYAWDFEDAEAGLSPFTVEDKDGDGFNWQYFNMTGVETGRMSPHEGEGLVASASYDKNGAGALTPNNWLVSPELTLGGALKFWAEGQDESWCDEVFGVYVTVDGTNWTQVGTDKTATGEYVEYEFDLSAYAGQTGKFAIVHHNVTDMFWLNVDDITFNPSGVVTPEPTLPINLTADPTATTANISWTAGDNNGSWDLRWRPYVDPALASMLWDLPYDGYSEQLAGWMIYDADGDGYGWGLSYTSSAQDDLCFSSASYYNYTALTPDNWLFTPEVGLGGTLKFKCCNASASYPDKIMVYICDNPEWESTDEFVAISDFIQPGEDWTEYEFDLSEYEGTGIIAFRHYDCTDEYAIYLDDIEIIPENPVEIPEWTLVSGATNPYTIEGLTPETEYEVQVMAYNEEGDKYTDWTESTHFTTLAEGGETGMTEFYLVGDFNDWNQTEEGGRIAFVEDEEGNFVATDVALEKDAEFKIITPSGDQENPWIWFGGQHEYTDYFLVTPDFYHNGTPITIVPNDPEGKGNFHMEYGPAVYKITLKAEVPTTGEGIAPKALTEPLVMVMEKTTAIETINVENSVKSGRFNLLGQPVNENYKGIVIENGVKKIQK